MESTQVHSLPGAGEPDLFDLLPDPRPRIITATPRRPAIVRLEYDDGTAGDVDFGACIRVGGIFQPLDDPAFFDRVQVAPHGRSLEWPGGLDFCSDALWLEVTGKARPISGDR